jgi:hypothetical protein
MHLVSCPKYLVYIYAFLAKKSLKQNFFPYCLRSGCVKYIFSKYILYLVQNISYLSFRPLNLAGIKLVKMDVYICRYFYSYS